MRRAFLAVLLAAGFFQVAFFTHIAIESFRLRSTLPRDYALPAIRRIQGEQIADRIPVDMNQVPAHLVYTLIAIEDHRFTTHAGFDVESIRRAIEINRDYGYRAYGASTLTQQLARTLFLYPRKSYFRKALEVEAAVIMDLVLGKERILELYLNTVEWGPGIFGVGTAADNYYQVSVDLLEGAQIVELLTILASPVLYSPESFRESEMLSLRWTSVARIYSFVSRFPVQKRVEIRSGG